MPTRSGCNYSNSSDNSQSVLPRDWLCQRGFRRLNDGGIRVIGVIVHETPTHVIVYDEYRKDWQGNISNWRVQARWKPTDGGWKTRYKKESFVDKGFFVVTANTSPPESCWV